jgi:hypothetical protein
MLVGGEESGLLTAR